MSVEKLLGVGYFEVAIVILGRHIIVLGLVTSLDEWDRVSNHAINIVYNQPWRLIEYKPGLSIVTTLSEDVTFNHDNAMQSDLLIV